LRNKIILIIIILLNIIPLYSEQYKLIGNYVLLSVSSNDGRFLLYGRSNKKDPWTPLLFEDFPSTSYFKFFQTNGTKIPFSEGGKNNISETKIIGNSIFYFWQNGDFKIEITYRFTSLYGDTSANTLYIELSVKNLTDREKSIDYFFCIDTFLGEKSHRHFMVDDRIINGEKEFKTDNLPHTVISYDDYLKYGINIFLNTDRQIPPSRIYFANWKRIDETIGLYKITDKQDFDLKPYSINDSACVQEYRNQKIQPGSKLDYRFVININNNIKNLQKIADNGDNGMKKDQTDDRTAKNKTDDKNTNTVKPDKGKKTVNIDVSEILNLIDSQNSKIKSDDNLTDEENQKLKDRLDAIKKDKSGN
jgi:hypothetical protein